MDTKQENVPALHCGYWGSAATSQRQDANHEAGGGFHLLSSTSAGVEASLLRAICSAFSTAHFSIR